MTAVLIDRHGADADHGVLPIGTLDVLEEVLGI